MQMIVRRLSLHAGGRNLAQRFQPGRQLLVNSAKAAIREDGNYIAGTE